MTFRNSVSSKFFTRRKLGRCAICHSLELYEKTWPADKRKGIGASRWRPLDSRTTVRLNKQIWLVGRWPMRLIIYATVPTANRGGLYHRDTSQENVWGKVYIRAAVLDADLGFDRGMRWAGSSISPTPWSPSTFTQTGGETMQFGAESTSQSLLKWSCDISGTAVSSSEFPAQSFILHAWEMLGIWNEVHGLPHDTPNQTTPRLERNPCGFHALISFAGWGRPKRAPSRRGLIPDVRGKKKTSLEFIVWDIDNYKNCAHFSVDQIVRH